MPAKIFFCHSFGWIHYVVFSLARHKTVFEFNNSYLLITASVPKELELYSKSLDLEMSSLLVFNSLSVMPYVEVLHLFGAEFCKEWEAGMQFLPSIYFSRSFSLTKLFPSMCLLYILVKNQMVVSVCIWYVGSTLMICMPLLCWYHVVFVIIILWYIWNQVFVFFQHCSF